MKNTGVTYSSTERTPSVLPEMAELLPPLSEEQLSALEQDILRKSRLWRNTLPGAAVKEPLLFIGRATMYTVSVLLWTEL